jgi:hypothetical protein
MLSCPHEDEFVFCLPLYINSQIDWQYNRLVTGTSLTQSVGGLPTLMLATTYSYLATWPQLSKG